MTVPLGLFPVEACHFCRLLPYSFCSSSPPLLYDETVNVTHSPQYFRIWLSTGRQERETRKEGKGRDCVHRGKGGPHAGQHRGVGPKSHRGGGEGEENGAWGEGTTAGVGQSP